MGKGGRPTRYKREFCELATNYALLGATDKEMAVFFGVSDRTFDAWKINHPEFLRSMKEGKEIADAKVGQRLFERATGYSHPDTHISNSKGKITVTEVTKHYPPDTTACIFWLKNRRPEQWREKSEVAHTGDVAFVLGGDDPKS